MIYRYVINSKNGYEAGVKLSEHIPSGDYVLLKPLVEFKTKSGSLLEGMEILVGQGYTVYRSIELMLEAEEFKKQTKELTRIKSLMDRGYDFSVAIREVMRLDKFSATYISAAEKSGRLVDALRELNRFCLRRRKIKNNVYGAALYPMVLTIMSLVLMIVMTRFVLPVFASMYSELGGELPTLTHMAYAIGEFISDKALMLTLVAVFLKIVYEFITTFSARIQYLRSKYKFNGSIFRRLHRDYFHESFFKRFAMIYSSNGNLDYTLNCLYKDEEDLYIRSCIEKILSAIRGGEEFSKVASKSGLFSTLTVSMLGEIRSSCKASDVANRISEYYSESFDQRISFISKLTGPVLILVIGIIISIMTLGIVLPLFETSNML